MGHTRTKKAVVPKAFDGHAATVKGMKSLAYLTSTESLFSYFPLFSKEREEFRLRYLICTRSGDVSSFYLKSILS